jgi:purine-cytosine permease-like protein
MTWPVIYILGALISFFLAAGWTFADFQREFPSIADERARSDAGFSVVIGLLTAAFWPLCLPVLCLITGLATHGWLAPWRWKDAGKSTGGAA